MAFDVFGCVIKGSRGVLNDLHHAAVWTVNMEIPFETHIPREVNVQGTKR